MPIPPTTPSKPGIGATNIPSAVLIEQLFNIDPSLIECLRSLSQEAQDTEVKVKSLLQNFSNLQTKIDTRSTLLPAFLLMGG